MRRLCSLLQANHRAGQLSPLQVWAAAPTSLGCGAARSAYAHAELACTRRIITGQDSFDIRHPGRRVGHLLLILLLPFSLSAPFITVLLVALHIW